MTVQLDVEALVASLSTTATIEYTACEPCNDAAGEALSSTAAPMLAQIDNTTPDIIETDGPEVVAVKSDDDTIRWEGILGFEGVLTGDGRFIMPDSLRWETLPLPIRVVFADVGAHDGAQVVGHIKSIERKPIKGVPNAWALWGEGTFDNESDAGKEAIRLVERELSNGISMDLDDVSFEVRVADQIPKADEKEDTAALDVEGLSALPGMASKVLTKVSPTDEITVTTSGRVRAATLVAVAAFSQAKVFLAKEKTEDPPESENDDPVAAVVAAGYDIPGNGGINEALEAFVGDGDPDTNWIEETTTGHLPPYIRSIADALMRTGASESHAIATAVNTVKRWASGGTVRANGGPHVLPDTIAKASAAIAEWEIKRAQAAANAAETVTLASGPVTVSASDSVLDPEPEYTPEQLEVLARAFRFKAFRDFTPKQREKAAEKHNAMPDGSYPIMNKQDLKNAIQAAGRAKDFEAVKRHIKRRARELDLEDLIPKDWATDLIMAV